ncbi:MAG: hypothetical protein ACYC2H_12310, partial [Thermoplasmatota archaeon]
LLFSPFSLDAAISDQSVFDSELQVEPPSVVGVVGVGAADALARRFCFLDMQVAGVGGGNIKTSLEQTRRRSGGHG